MAMASPPHDAIHEDAGRGDALRVEISRLQDLFDLYDGDSRRRGHDSVEVAGRASVRGVAQGVRLVRSKEGEVRRQPRLQQALPPVERPHLLAFCDDGAHAGGRVEGGNPGAAGPNALGQRPLRQDLQLDLALAVGQLEGVRA